ncbi:hypothetical protein EIN_173670 [Entamoeba invadens IP1]|uniref:Leucine rich repeat containing protein BspA family protein n=1 Tax=Entamoeba invadens IP1 TaxID=370355 RepID=A0A0A1TW11_ENTIV|nr:hypothetical protein EIN_173670 [Entamoeba invadens IP1]ELP84692.1 hypothetical protein EIN_173670 [Entamoeba invadens IP1]|eukprot:XP_004184038.1 hypothetical protein EIN_173670 [Entamoeba invadens IP1]
MVVLDGFHMMVVSQYFGRISDFIELSFVCKKFTNIMEKFHYNPVPLLNNNINLFTHLETLYLYSKTDDLFENKNFYRRVFLPKINYSEFVQLKKKTNVNVECVNVMYTKEDVRKHGLVLPKEINHVDQFAYYQISIPQFTSFETSLKTIGQFAFSFCNNIQNLYIPKSVTSIDSYSFYKCTNLKSVSFGCSICRIGGLAFCECKSLVDVKLPEKLDKLEEVTFSGCAQLKTIEIPKSVTSIGNRCFLNCTNLESVVMGSTLITFGVDVFYGCIFKLPTHINKERL